MQHQAYSDKRYSLILLTVMVMVVLLSATVTAQTTGFTYQGKLSDGGNPASGDYDMQFKLFDALTDGNQIGASVTNPTVAVANGVFTVQLDFGVEAFDGTPRFLEICLRPANDPNPYTLLSPRQPLTSTPYAIKSLNAAAADGLSIACVNCITSSQIQSVNGSAVSGEIPVASVPAGSPNYIQNTTTPQATADFNISGDGTAGGTLSGNLLNATTQYNLDGNRVLSNAGTRNLFAGVGAGQANLTGTDNAFFGFNAGAANTTGSDNAFFGEDAGAANMGGFENAFFGRSAGAANTFGCCNSFFGKSAGVANISGRDNAFFGVFAGSANTGGSSNAFFGAFAGSSNTGSFNAFFGNSAGRANLGGSNNAFFGLSAGQQNMSGNFNAFFGARAGFSNTIGIKNTAIGDSADVGSGNLEFATAIGAGAVVTASSRVQIGRVGGDTVAIGAFASPTSSTPVCINGNGVFVNCTASSRRYKDRIQPFTVGLHLIQRLRPVSFLWKEGQQADLGLIAEEVAKVEPLLVTHNKQGEVEGVKYTQLNVVLINAIKEQQAQIHQQQQQINEQQAQSQLQQQQIKQQQRQIEALTKLLCQQNPQAAICK